MGAVFTLFGTLKVDTVEFASALRQAETRLGSTSAAIDQTEQKARQLGQTSEVTGRQFQKLHDSVDLARQRVIQTATAFEKGEATAKQMAGALTAVDRAANGVGSRVADMGARISDAGNKVKGSGLFSGAITGGIIGGIMGGAVMSAVSSFTSHIKTLAVDSVKMAASFDQLARYTSTLDHTFQSASALKRFKADMMQLSIEVPQTAENIAKASFTVKSAYQNMTEPQVIEFLRKMSNAAVASNTTVDEHASRVAALARVYKLNADQLDEFSAILTTTFGQSLAVDKEVGEGFQSLIMPAINAHQSLNELASAMGAVQSKSTDAALNSTMLRQVLIKLVDPAFAAGMKEIFNIDLYDAAGKMRGLNAIVNELSKSLANMTDKERAAALAPIMKDQRKAQGWQALMSSLDEYNKALKDGASAQAFQDKHSVMLDSTENRWALFYNRLKSMQTQAGDSMTKVVMPVLESKSSEEAAGNIGSGLWASIKKGLTWAGDQYTQYLVNDSWLNPGTKELVNANVTKTFSGLSESIAVATMKDQQALAEREKQYWSAVLADPIASPDIKAKATANIAEYVKKIHGLTTDIAIALNNGKPGIEKAVNNLITADTPSQFGMWGSIGGTTYADKVVAGIVQRQEAVKTAANDLVPTDTSRASWAGRNAGRSLGQGMINGIRSMFPFVGATSAEMGSIAESALNFRIERKSPSKLFHRIGIDIGQGLVDGIKAMRSPVTAAASSMLDTAAVKKAIAEQVKDLQKQIKDATTGNAATTGGYSQTIGSQVKLAGLEDMKSVLADVVKLRIELEANIGKPLVAGDEAKAELIRLQTIKERLDDLTTSIKDAIKEAGNADPIGKMIDLFANEEATNGIIKRAAALKLTVEMFKQLALYGELFKNGMPEDILPPGGSGREPNTNADGLPMSPDVDENDGIMPPPKAKPAWEDFWATMRTRIEAFKVSMQSVKATIGESLLNGIQGIGDVFANALNNWDGTAKGFFKSLASGFKQLVSQILQELVRIMVMRAVFAIIGMFAGGAGAGAGGGVGAGAIGGAGAGVGAAEGGFISGPGTSTSDSILARLSNGEFVMKASAVSKFGPAFFEKLNNGFATPAPAFAGGGMVGFAGGGMVTTSSSVTNSPTININVLGGGSNGMQTARQIQREVTMALRREDLRNK